MKILFVHNNFPAQFRHIARALQADARAHLAAICASTAPAPDLVRTERYDAPREVNAHMFARRFDNECRRAEQVLYAALRLKREGFCPDIIVAHSGWGETLPLREVFPASKIVVYSEFYYRSRGQDVGFDPEFPEFGVDGRVAVNLKNAAQLLALADADVAVSPTLWQRSSYPPEYHRKIQVIHEGIDTDRVAPDDRAAFGLAAGDRLTAHDEVITFVARNLEPLRGVHVLLRALPDILARRPRAQVVIAGGDSVSYGPPVPAPFASWRDCFWAEIAPHVDHSRIHFAGVLAYPRYVQLLQISTVHVYLTYPFVLSWSLLEAMSASCSIVASDTSPVAEVVTPDVGQLVPFFDRAALVDGVIAALERRADWEGARRRARETIVSSYDMASVCCPKFMRLLRDL